ncbi:zinc carboxypeptidase [Leptospira yanagawae serovar Saopaulo str. Sao Paulo = ATCC 700523]|uniref:Zinc carboxypeptidase n=1 Tax=Leptospira yanagawae serovar Saopaulo str. Sao Paulo = ATCC 700523 TaxID=1249483 RepID=A0A5E8HCU7_9LEPT|nr:M14 family zinc carboxypeptidase [Leptospira yanagawae]EOQ88597.1 zinc carboxypeptidase [Leptospira yanagawae serovar Saopaulo str. Sao Paulo = ATCC 700523]
MLRGMKRLNRYENRILRIVKLGGKLVRLKQYGFSSKTEEGFRFPIYVLEIGKPKAIKKNVSALVAGVHGLETIGIRVLLDFLDHLLTHKTSVLYNEIKNGELGIVCIPILNPGGVAMKRRSNPRGVDLMRNSGVEAVKAPFFFGGHKYSNFFPYYRGNVLQSESRVLDRFFYEYLLNAENEMIPVVDIHSGFGTIDHVWWPYASIHRPCADEPLFQKMANHFTNSLNHYLYRFGPQSETYTTHGDLWDRLYDLFLERANSKTNAQNSRFLPLTLEMGTWSDIKIDPWKIFRKRGIFNPARESKQKSIISHRKFLSDVMRLAKQKVDDLV